MINPPVQNSSYSTNTPSAEELIVQHSPPRRAKSSVKESTAALFRPAPKPQPIREPEPEIQPHQLLSADGIMTPIFWMIATAFTTGMMLYVGKLAMSMPAPAGVELSNKMVSFVWIPLGLCLLCFCRLLISCTADDPLIRKAAPMMVPSADMA